jgi:hypothetical protein
MDGSEAQLMAFGIRRPVPPMAVLRIAGLLEDAGTSFSRALKVLVDVLHIDVKGSA